MLRRMSALALLTAAVQGYALTLGPVQGKAVIGRSLDLVVSAAADGTDTESGQCPQAEVSYGDSRLPDALVTVSGLASGTAGWRVRASPPVNEPLVTLLLRVGCSALYSRSYVLLVDQDEPVRRGAATEPPARTRPVLDLPDASLVQAPVQLPAPRQRPSGIERLPAKTRPVADVTRTVKAGGADKPVAQQAAVPERLGPRLELELLEHGPALPPPAIPAAEAAPGPASAGAEGRQPASQRTAGAGQDLTGELQALRAEQARTQAVVAALQAQLAESRQPRWQDPLVLALLGLSSASLLALAWSWFRLQRQRWARAEPDRRQ